VSVSTPTRRMGRGAAEESFIGFRVGVLLAIGMIMLGIVGFRLWYLQILSGDEFVGSSVSNRERTVIIEAPRGGIYDRFGEPLVDNRAGLSVGFLVMDMPDPDTPEFYDEIFGLSDVLDIPVAQLLADYEKARTEPHKTHVIKEDVDENTVVAYLEEHNQQFPGIEIETSFLREYTAANGANAAHILGYVGEISDADLDEPEFAELKGGTHVGKDGVERQYDQFLRGKDGWRTVEVDASGRPVAVVDDVQADTGSNLYLTIDSELQAAVEQALGEGIWSARQFGYNAPAGSVVALDPSTGEILAMASFPDYEPEKWVGGISTVDFAAYLADDAHRPLFNRAMNGLYPPGSTFKPFIASVVVQRDFEEGDLPVWEEGADCRGTYRVESALGDATQVQTFRCWSYPYGHHEVNLWRALTVSCDIYFYKLGRATYDLDSPVLQNGLRQFGFGRSTGIDLPGETQGSVVPDKVWARENGVQWKPGDEVQLAIGQGDMLATPLQEAVALAAIVNGGRVLVPHVGLKITDSSNRVISTIQSDERAELDMSDDVFDAVKDGMVRVCNNWEGTAYDVWKGFSVDIAGKTGTSEVRSYYLGEPQDDYSLFMGYAPANDVTEPQIVVVAVVEQGGHGSWVAAPIVRRVMEAYFDLPRGRIVIDTGYTE